MQKILTLLRAHWGIVISAIVIAILVMSPVIMYPFLAGDTYQGINIGSGVDEAHYIGRGKEILEGHALGNVFFREGKDNPSTQHSIIEYILVYPLKLLGVTSGETLTTMYYLYTGIGIFTLTLLVYLLVWQMTKNKLLALTTAVFVIGGHQFIIFNKMNAQFSNFTFDLNTYQRVTFPIWSSVPFFVFFNLLYKSLKTQGWKYIIFTGLTFGLLFYIYFFAWSFALFVLGCLWLVALIRRDFQTVKKIMLISGIGVLIGLYNLISMIQYEQSTLGSQTLFISKHRDFGHNYKISGLSVCLTLLFLIFLYKRKNDLNWPFFLSIILAGWVSLNTQVITGQVLQDFHYSSYFVYPTTIIMGIYMIWSLLKNPRLQKIFLLLLLAGALVDTVAREYRGTFALLELKNHAQQYRPVINYLNKQEPSVVLFSDLYYSELAVVYTNHDLLWADLAYFYYFPIERLEDIINVYYYLDTDGRKGFSDFIYGLRAKRAAGLRSVYPHPIYELSSYTTTKVQDEAMGELLMVDTSYFYSLYRYIEAYQLIFTNPKYSDKPTLYQQENIVTDATRKEVVDELAKKFHEITKDPANIVNILKKYQVRYLIWDEKRQPTWDMSILPGLQEVLTTGSIHLYELTY